VTCSFERGSALILLAAFVPLLPAHAVEDRIRPGDTVRGFLEAAGPDLVGYGASGRFELEVAEAGPVTLLLESHDFDAFLRVELADGTLVVEDDDGHLETNARIVVPAAAGARYRVVVAADGKGSGEFVLRALRGEAPRLEGGARLDAAIAFRQAALERALAKQDKDAAFLHRIGRPLDEAGSVIERVVIVPSAALAALPFEALVVAVPASGRPSRFADVVFVIDQYEVCYSPSSPVIVELGWLGPRRGGGKALILADPTYASEIDASATLTEVAPEDSMTTVSASGSSRLLRLEKTREEALAIARLLRSGDPGSASAAGDLEQLAGRRSGSLSDARFDLHLGDAASAERLSGDLTPYAMIHLAAHGFAGGAGDGVAGVGLAASRQGRGFVSLEDVLNLDLDADLVVLSACDTARGELRERVGIESMARGFMHSGARGVVASFWQVSEEAAVETMKSFYEGLIVRRLSPSQALREAKLGVRRSEARPPLGDVTMGAGELRESPAPSAGVESAHPFFWAPFGYFGLPR
jgi:CHAT domain-containing protein